MLLKIRAPNGKSGIWPMTDIGNGSSFAPAIGLTPAVTASLGGLPAYADITMADGSDIHPFPGMATLIAGSGGFAAAGAAGAGSAFGAAVQQLKKLKIVGHGALQSLAQAAADKHVVNAANKFIVSKQPVMTAAGAPGSGPLTNLVRGKPGAPGVSRYVNPDGTLAVAHTRCRELDHPDLELGQTARLARGHHLRLSAWCHHKHRECFQSRGDGVACRSG